MKGSKTYKILVVEDEDLNYAVIETMLDFFEDNFIPIRANHGEKAVEICKDDPDIDIVLMDLKMPVMNGFEATQLIKEFRPELAVIAQTAFATQESRSLAESTGFDGFITKPINEEALREVLQDNL
ncbi:MAG: response regulator [Bacteroidota bacterium]